MSFIFFTEELSQSWSKNKYCFHFSTDAATQIEYLEAKKCHRHFYINV